MCPVDAAAEVDVVVIGAGFAGLYQLYRLRESGLTYRVFEAASGPGGVWYWNRYPGARCDTESTMYSYGFSPELEQDWTWTERFASQPEILRYLEHVADRFDLRRDITFDTRVERAVYRESAKRWRITTDTGEVLDARFLVTAVGCISATKYPEIPGLERFGGRMYHTSRWPHEGVDFTGKRVALIGTGSSGIQSLPLIAAQASSVTVFQRTPAFSLDANNRALTADEVAEIKSTYRQFRAAQRASSFGIPRDPATKATFDVSEEERQAQYQLAWERGSVVDILGAFTDTLVDREANETAAEFVRAKIRSIVTDPEVAERLSPRTYAIGAKRPCLDTDYYSTYNLDHVELVDLIEHPIVEITETGLRTADGDYEFDAMVFATGFDGMTGSLTGIDIRGVGGRSLREVWVGGARTYLGLAVHGFPNMFTITGPFSPSVLGNVVISIEQHVEWITDCLKYLREHGLVGIAADQDAEDTWIAHANDLSSRTLFPTADSWWLGANVPGKARVFLPYVGGIGEYRRRCDEVAASGYKGFTLS